jgi:hypothetical protein
MRIGGGFAEERGRKPMSAGSGWPGGHGVFRGERLEFRVPGSNIPHAASLSQSAVPFDGAQPRGLERNGDADHLIKVGSCWASRGRLVPFQQNH